ncbi:MAG: efflux RND transporter periplasmic adaptor subunit [gamma proteobacterium symbiont of Bathyaustriella thionipta]|nr:efflux RND transporter periplasmic adaptor subunit [gamma proteobacterium symbiont of Bathyaustriella thionipta]
MAGIVTQKLQAQQVNRQIMAPGEIRRNQYTSSLVTPRIEAQILQRMARLGDTVTKGQALVLLSSVDLTQAEGDLLLADREWQRVRKLGKKVVAEQRYTGARVARELALAKVLAYGMTETEVKQLLDSGRADLADGRFRLLAPQDGTIIADDFVMGELVEPGRVLFDISDESLLWVDARVVADEVSVIRKGASARVLVHSDWIEGKVVQVHHALDENTRTLGVRIEIPNPGDRLHPGMFVSVRIEGTTTESVLAVPSDAVLRSPDGDWQVFVEQDEGEYEPREIDVIRQSSGLTVIEGLPAGSRIVTQGVFFVQSELAKSGFEIHNH